LQLKYELILNYTKAAMNNQNVTPFFSIFSLFNEIDIEWFSSKDVSGGSSLRPSLPPQPNLA
jgi:hypothetical protein